jgi:hypothetical protein
MIMNKKRLSGIIMFCIGFVMILISALGYLFNWDTKSPALTIMGLVFVAIGLQMARKSPA